MPEPAVLLTDLGLGESPRWHGDRLWFADWLAREIVAVDKFGRSEVMARPATFPISVDWLPGGDLLVVSGHTLHGRRPDGDLVPRTDLSELSELPWNEIVVDDRDNTFVNNVGFDLLSGAEAAPGLIAVVTGDGAPRKVAGDVWFPNGMAVAAPAPRAGHP